MFLEVQVQRMFTLSRFCSNINAVKRICPGLTPLLGCVKKAAVVLAAAAAVVTMQLRVSAADSTYAITQREIGMLEAVVMHEVGYCSRDSMIAVAHVVLNRVESPLFPDTVEQVLHQPGQFTAIHNYYDQERPVSAQVRSAVADALQIPDVTGGALYFYNPGYMQDGPVLDWFESLETTLVFEEVWYCK